MIVVIIGLVVRLPFPSLAPLSRLCVHLTLSFSAFARRLVDFSHALCSYAAPHHAEKGPGGASGPHHEATGRSRRNKVQFSIAAVAHHIRVVHVCVLWARLSVFVFSCCPVHLADAGH